MFPTIAGPVATALLTLTGGATADSLGARFPGLRAAVEERANAEFTIEGTADGERERRLLETSLECLDRDSPTLAQDLLLAAKAVAPLVRCGLHEDPEVGPLVLGLRDGLRAAVAERLDLLALLRVYVFEEGDREKFDRTVDAAGLRLEAAGDPAGIAAAFPALRKALRTVEKGERCVARLTRPRPAAFLDVALIEYKPPFSVEERHAPGSPSILAFQVSWSAGTGTAFVDLTVDGDGGARVLSVPIPAPAVGPTPVIESSPTLDDLGTGCVYVPFVETDGHEIRLFEWDPANGVAAGRMHLLFHDLEEPFSCFMAFSVIFTVEDVAVVP
jgi:hypothetical protein